jgi:hypothetical protein
MKDPATAIEKYQAMQTLLSAPLRPDVMARRIPFRHPVPDAGEEYEAPV